MRVKAFWAWYDFWVGVYYDRDKRHIYICPLPMVVFQLILETREERRWRRVRDGFQRAIKRSFHRKESGND